LVKEKYKKLKEKMLLNKNKKVKSKKNMIGILNKKQNKAILMKKRNQLKSKIKLKMIQTHNKKAKRK